jgi:RimJ/RimL family protein N-acetyltransferase
MSDHHRMLIRQSLDHMRYIETMIAELDTAIGEKLRPYEKQIELACAQKSGFVCHIQTGKMAELMATADLAIGAGGATTWERCSMGLPALAICTADNQRKQLADAARQGLLYSPEIKKDLGQTIRSHISALIENDYLRQSISCNGIQLVDGRGVLRVIASMGCGDIEIRMARPDDSEKLFQWRNHPSIREVSSNAEMIGWQDHQRWFASVLDDTDIVLLIGQSAGHPVGVVRFDVQNDEAQISIYLIPEKLSSGLGSMLLQSAEQWLADNRPEVNRVRAHVLGANVRSQRLFSRAGYQVDSICFSKKLCRK